MEYLQDESDAIDASFRKKVRVAYGLLPNAGDQDRYLDTLCPFPPPSSTSSILQTLPSFPSLPLSGRPTNPLQHVPSAIRHPSFSEVMRECRAYRAPQCGDAMADYHDLTSEYDSGPATGSMMSTCFRVKVSPVLQLALEAFGREDDVGKGGGMNRKRGDREDREKTDHLVKGDKEYKNNASECGLSQSQIVDDEPGLPVGQMGDNRHASLPGSQSEGGKPERKYRMLSWTKDYSEKTQRRLANEFNDSHCEKMSPNKESDSRVGPSPFPSHVSPPLPPPPLPPPPPLLSPSAAPLSVNPRSFNDLPRKEQKAMVIGKIESAMSAVLKTSSVEESIGIDAIRKTFKRRITRQWSLDAVYKGVALARRGLDDEALKCYAMALEIDPLNPEALVANGAALANLQRFEESLECLEEVIKMDPNHPNASAYLTAVRKKYDDFLMKQIDSVAYAKKKGENGSKAMGSSSIITNDSITATATTPISTDTTGTVNTAITSTTITTSSTTTSATATSSIPSRSASIPLYTTASSSSLILSPPPRHVAGLLQRYESFQYSDEKRKERVRDGGGGRDEEKERRGADRKPGAINKGGEKDKEETSYDSLYENFDSKQRRKSRIDDDDRRGKRRRRRSDSEDESHRGSSRDDGFHVHRHHHHHRHYDRDSDHRSMGRESLKDKGWKPTEIMDPKVKEALELVQASSRLQRRRERGRRTRRSRSRSSRRRGSHGGSRSRSRESRSCRARVRSDDGSNKTSSSSSSSNSSSSNTSSDSSNGNSYDSSNRHRKSDGSEARGRERGHRKKGEKDRKREKRDRSRKKREERKSRRKDRRENDERKRQGKEGGRRERD